jgi:hypothetical protein
MTQNASVHPLPHIAPCTKIQAPLVRTLVRSTEALELLPCTPKGAVSAPRTAEPQGFSVFRFRFGSRHGPEVKAAHGSRSMVGFGVMRSPDRGHSKGGRRIASAALLDRLHRSSDAAAPESRTRNQLETGLASLRPSTTHQKAGGTHEVQD